MEQEYKYMVCTVCATYNHAPYIVDAMNGFTMQETTFPVYYLITDDASTDGEPEVIKQYLAEHFQTPYRIEETDDYHLICATHKINPNCNFIVFLLKYNHYSIKKSKLPYQTEWRDNAKYIAFCEGDDYWINPQKLQKQVDFLDAHPDFTICATNAIVLWEKGEKSPSYFRKFYEEGEFTMSQLIGNWAFATATLIYRKTVKDDYPEWTKQLYFGDMTLMLIATHYGRFQVLSDVTSVYRKTMKNEGSVTRALADKMDYVNLQQVKLYEAFNEWTERKYSDAVLKEIRRRKKEVKFYRYRRLGKLVPYIMMPAYMISKRLKKN